MTVDHLRTNEPCGPGSSSAYLVFFFFLAKNRRSFLVKRLEQERQELLKEGQNLDTKIGDIRKRMSEA